jgi:UDP-N-acetylglucosamine diphosphorylase/glucosamine-1-phosphate N-acetyltransferase
MEQGMTHSPKSTSQNPHTITQAIILAAGKGERLGVLTYMRPKVMLPVGNKPIVEYIVEALAANGIRDIVLVVGYHRELIQDYLGSGERFGVNLRYVAQEHQLGTGHALSTAEDFANQRFLVLPGDNIVTASAIQDLVNAEENAILVTDQARGEQYGAVDVKLGKVVELIEKPHEQTHPWGNTGGYLLSHQIFMYLSQEFELPTAINHMIRDGATFVACETTTGWFDAVYPWDLLKLNGLALAATAAECMGECEPGVTLKGAVTIHPGSVIRANSYIVGPVTIGEGCEIGPGTVIYPYTSVGSNVVIESFTQLRNSIIGDMVQIGSHSHLTDTIVGAASSIGSYFMATTGNTQISLGGKYLSTHMGAIISENVTIGSHVSVRPGTMIGSQAQIGDMTYLQHDVPESTHVI